MGCVRRSRWRSRPLMRPRLTQAASEEVQLKLHFVNTFVEKARELGLSFDVPTSAAAAHYLEVARSTPCFMHLLDATSPASRHGRCSHCSVMMGI